MNDFNRERFMKKKIKVFNKKHMKDKIMTLMWFIHSYM